MLVAKDCLTHKCGKIEKLFLDHLIFSGLKSQLEILDKGFSVLNESFASVVSVLEEHRLKGVFTVCLVKRRYKIVRKQWEALSNPPVTRANELEVSIRQRYEKIGDSLRTFQNTLTRAASRLDESNEAHALLTTAGQMVEIMTLVTRSVVDEIVDFS